LRALIRKVVLPVHRWTALTVGLVVLWMALTGLGLLFKVQLEPAVDGSLETVAACHVPQPVDQLVARARAAHPDGVLRLIGIEGSTTRSTWIRFGNGDTVYVDPCSGRVVGELNKYRGLFGALEYLHRLEFLSGADHAVAGTVALAFALVIVIGGIAIWWPVSLKGLRWSVTFAMRPAGRTRLMRIHRATGFWVCLIVLCSALTGPIDSFHWYQRVIAAVIDPVQRSPEVAADAKVVGANVAAANVPAGAAGARAQGASAPAQGPRLTLETLWQRSQQVTPNPQEALLLLPKTPSSPVELDIIERSAPNHQAVSVLRLDPYDGRVLGFEPYAASSLANKVMAWGIAIHAGQAGVPAQMALLVGVLGIIVLGYTGLSSYVRRRLGAWRDRARARPLAVGA
jgi:vanillate O-demethylase ferredoxin subunit